MAAELAVRFHRLADAEMHEAADWYDERSPGVGDSFLDEAVALAEDIATAPERWPVIENVSPETRYRLMHTYPYTLFYRRNDAGLLVLAVAHQKRRPLYWARRR